MKKQKIKNGDKVVFIENPFALQELSELSELFNGEPVVVVQYLDPPYFNFAIPKFPHDACFTAHLSWVKKFEE
jgi:hypothetical protein